MAKLYGEIAAKALLTLDKSFARANGQPLDASEVYYSKAAAETYAATAQAYIGQKIVVIENGVVTHYSVEDTAGTLKELGSKPVADGTTVAIGEDGKITLANITESEATGTYNAVLVNGKLTWVKPSETTVEGLSDLIQALTGRVETAEGEIDALQEAVGVASKPESAEGAGDAVAATGLHKAIEDEVARAAAAERALGERIDAIDFVDNDELTTALEPYATKTYVGEEIAKIEVPVTSVAADDKVLSLVDKVLSATVALGYDEENKTIKLTGKDGADLGSIDATPFIKDGMLEDVSYDADSNTLTFKWNTVSGVSEDTVVLSDIIEPYTAGNGLELTDNSFAVKLADGTESFLTVSADGLKLSGVQAAIDAAKQAAIDDAATKYATTGALDAVSAVAEAAVTVAEMEAHVSGAIENKADKADSLSGYGITDAYTKTQVDDLINNINEGNQESAGAVNTKLETYIANNDSRVEIIENKLTTVEENAEKNIIEVVKVNGSALTPDENRAVDVIVPTKFSDLTDDSGFTELINANATGVTEAKSAASAAQSAANQAQSEVDALEITVGTLQSTVEGHTNSISDHGTRIGVLEQADATHATEYNELKTIVTGHTTEIAKKANTTDLDAAIARIAVNEGAIKTINETTVPGLETEIGKKANAADVYTKSEVDSITGTPDEGKTLVQMIKDAQTNATYDDTKVKEDIQKNADAIAVLNGTVDTAGSVLYVSKAQAELAARNEVSALVGAAPDALNTLEEIAAWIAEDETGTTALIDRVIANEAALIAINDVDTGILAEAKKYTDDQIDAIPAATAEALGLVKVDDVSIQANDGVLSVKAVSTDLLT